MPNDHPSAPLTGLRPGFGNHSYAWLDATSGPFFFFSAGAAAAWPWAEDGGAGDTFAAATSGSGDDSGAQAAQLMELYISFG